MLKSIINAGATSQQNEFVDLYKDMLTLYRKEGKDKVDMQRLRRLEALVDQQYGALDNHQKDDMIRLLAKNDLVPQTWVDLIETFDTSIGRIT